MNNLTKVPLSKTPPATGEPPYFSADDLRFVLYRGDCLKLMPLFPDEAFDMIFADPPYFLSNGGVTCHAGKMVSVNKGKWDRSLGFKGNYDFTRNWLSSCQRLLKPNGSIWISGTSHIIHIVGSVLDELGYKILNDITWVKKNPPPNLSCRYFTHATETIIWAGRDKKCRHKFNYQLMKQLNAGKQMKSVWTMDAPRRDEKVFGKHPTQKPLALLERIIAASSDEDDCVFDPFAGSSTTGIAAARLNRPFTGVELEERFLDIGICRFIGIPQADNPERLLNLMEEQMSDNPSPAELVSRLGITVRQVQYYRQAASILGLLNWMNNHWVVTELGKTIFSNNKTPVRAALAHKILELPLVQSSIRKTRKCRTRQAQGQVIAEFLSCCTSLGKSTCLRRARTIMSWINWALTHCDVSDGYITSPSKNANDSAVPKNLKLLPDLRSNIKISGMPTRQFAFKFIDPTQ